ncbi:MAG: DUF2520 domain-containing protein [Thermoanaerobaculaceae bacterium]
MTKWLIVGAGRCGLQLALALARKTPVFAGVVCRSNSSFVRASAVLPKEQILSWSQEFPQNTNLLIAVQDRKLEAVVQALGQRKSAHPVILHTSGSRGPQPLAPLKETGAALGVFHPLVPFPHPSRPRVRLQGATVTLAGDPEAVAAARILAQGLGMRPVICSSLDWRLYHAAANLAGPLLYALLLTARQELARAGFPQEEAATSLQVLARSVLHQVSRAQAWELLTGPMARGDTTTVQAHLAVLESKARAVYEALTGVVPPPKDSRSE